MAIHSGRGGQAGSVLLEAMLAVVIFSFGVLGLIGLQATAIKQGADAQYRSAAALLADKLLGTMRTGGATIADLQTKYGKCTSTSCTGYVNWRDSDVKAALPGVVNNTPTEPNVNVAADGTVTITIRWHPPSEDTNVVAYHEYVTVARIAKN